MANYYGLVSGLADLNVDQQSLPYSLQEYEQILESVLSKADMKLLELLKYDNLNKLVARTIEKNLIESPIADSLEEFLLEAKEKEELIEQEETEQALFSQVEFAQIRYMAENSLPMPQNIKTLPKYLVEYIYQYYFIGGEDDGIDEEKKEEKSNLSILDEISLRYYNTAINSKNKFISSWFEFNKNIRNILAAYTARKFGWNISDYVLGNSDIDIQLKTSNARDFSISEIFEYMPNILAISEEKDIARKERMIDLLIWQWLDEENFAKVFDTSNVLSYYIRLSIIDRWISLNKEKGEETFRSIVMGLKESSRASLQDFKDKQRK